MVNRLLDECKIGCYNSLLQTHHQQIGCSDCWGWFNFSHRLDLIFESVCFRNQKMVKLQCRIFTSEIDITSVAATNGPTPMYILWLQLSASCFYLTWFNPWYHGTTLLEKISTSNNKCPSRLSLHMVLSVGEYGTLGWTGHTSHGTVWDTGLDTPHTSHGCSYSECWEGGSGRDTANTLHTSGKFPSLGNYSPVLCDIH